MPPLLRALLLTVAGAGFALLGELLEEARGGGGHRLDGPLDFLRSFLRHLGDAGHFTDVLQSRGANFVGRGGRLEVVEDADVTTHAKRGYEPRRPVSNVS